MATTDIEALKTRLLQKARIDPARGCWIWTGRVSDDGYARTTIKGYLSRSGVSRLRLWRGVPAPTFHAPPFHLRRSCLLQSRPSAGEHRKRSRQANRQKEERTRRLERLIADRVTLTRVRICTSIRVAGATAASAWRTSRQLTKREIRRNTSPGANPSFLAIPGLTYRGAVSGTLVCR